jgi:hypothetical protein
MAVPEPCRHPHLIPACHPAVSSGSQAYAGWRCGPSPHDATPRKRKRDSYVLSWPVCPCVWVTTLSRSARSPFTLPVPAFRSVPSTSGDPSHFFQTLHRSMQSTVAEVDTAPCVSIPMDRRSMYQYATCVAYLPFAPFLGRLSTYHDNAKQLMADPSLLNHHFSTRLV